MIGVEEPAWHPEDAVRVLELLRPTEIAVLGGDLYVKRSGQFERSHENWYAERVPQEMPSEFATRSQSIAREYLANLTKSGAAGRRVTLVLSEPMEPADGEVLGVSDMAVRVLVLSGSRSLAIGSPQLALEYPLHRPFVALVPAFDAGEREQVESMAGTLIDRGCTEFCCVGPEAERLHDSLDGIIEEKGAIDVVTTWHTDYADACEYFLIAAGGKPPTLLALISSHPNLTAVLEDEAKAG